MAKIPSTHIERGATAHDAGGGHDEWHTHRADEGTAQHAHTAEFNTRIIFVWFLAIIVTLVVVVFGVIKYFDITVLAHKRDNVETDTLAKDYLAKRAALDTELSTNGQPRRFVALGDRRVQIPIGDAMERVVDQYGQGGRGLTVSLPHQRTPLE